MFEIIERTTSSNQYTPNVLRMQTRIIVCQLAVYQKQTFIDDQATAAIVEDCNQYPNIGDCFIPHIPNSGGKAHPIAEKTITDVCTVHIDLTDQWPLWIDGQVAHTSHREVLAKDLGFGTWRQFTDHFKQQYGRKIFNGFVISWEI